MNENRSPSAGRARQRVIGGALVVLCIALAQVAGAQSPPPSMPSGHPPTVEPRKPAPDAAPATKIDINKASRAELKTLPGIGDAEAAKIIANRPFLTKVDLVTLKILPEGVYAAIRDRIVATQSGKPLQKK